MSKQSGDGDEAKPKKTKKVRKKKVVKKKAAKWKPPPVRKKGPGKKILRVLIAVLLLAGLGKMAQKSMEQAEEKKITKQYVLLISAMDKLYFGCTVYWSGEGRGEDCSLDIWKRVSGRKYDEIKITIMKGQRHEFAARAKHPENDKVFQVDHKGDVYLNIDGCLPKIDFKELTMENVHALEKKCPPKGTKAAPAK